MIRVAHVIPSISARLGGPAVAMCSYARALQMQGGVKLTILTTTRLLEREERATLPHLDGVDIRIFNAVGNTSRSFSINFMAWLLRHIKEFDLIHIHAIFNPVSLSACWIASFSGTPYIIRPLGTLSPFTRRLYSHGLKKIYYTLLAKPVLNKAVYVHCTTVTEEQKVLQWLPQRTAVIPIPFEPNGWLRSNRYDCGTCFTSRPTILFLSRLHPKKNVHLLVEAVGRLKRNGFCKPRLILAGEGNSKYIAYLRECTRNWDVEDCTEWPGFVTGKEKENLFRTADIFALPSQDENFGVAVVEAMAHGLPVVVSREVDLAPVIQQYQAGLTVELTGKSVSLALEKLLKDTRMRSEFGQNGRCLVQKELNPERVGRQLVDVYTSILT